MKKCLVCGQSRYSHKIARNKVFNWDILFCSKCRLAYSFCDDEVMQKVYPHFYKKNYWHGSEVKCERDFKTLIEKLKRFVVESGIPPLIHVSHYHLIKKHMPRVNKGKLLDIGTGKGDALRFFKSKGYAVMGIEPDKNNADKINKRFKKKICVAADAENYNITGEFDVIYLCHVLEHFVSPLPFLRRIKNNLGKNSILFVEVPNCQNKEMMKISLGMESHTYHFTMQSLSLLFKKAGYKVLLSGVYDDVSPNLVCSFFRSLLQIPSYRQAGLKSGKKIIIIARR